MAFVQDQTGGDDSGTSFSTFTINFATNVTIHNTLAVSIDNALTTTVTASDAKVDTFTPVDTLNSGNPNNQTESTFYVKDAIGGATDVIGNFSPATPFVRIGAIEFSGRNNTAPLDGHNMAKQTAPGTGADGATSGSLSTTATDDIAGFIHATGAAPSTIAGGTNYTGEKQLTTAVGLVGMNEMREAASSGPNAVTFTLGTSVEVITSGLAFKAAAAGSVPPIGRFVAPVLLW